MEDAKAWLTLARASALHAGQLREWFAQSRSPLELLGQSAATLAALGLSAGTVRALCRPDAAALESDLRWLAGGARRQLVVWGDALYPPVLAQIPDAPLVLFVAGAPAALSGLHVAIVGSRNPTAVGRDTAAEFAAHLARAGLAITSGLALGIDAAAHEGALRAGGITVAVVGRGHDEVYPRENAALAERVAAGGGALVTDIPIGVGPLPQNFPRRNRILSGLAAGTLVVEAALQSGSLITARLAAEQGREVFAIPGSIHSAVSRGCHRLLRQGAKLVETAGDILEEIAPNFGELAAIKVALDVVRPTSGLPSLDKDHEILLDAVGFDPAGLDAIVARTGFETGAVASMLLMLELDGRIQQQPGGRYSRRVPGKVK
ncbi:MAG: DNA-processing protein DprA [Steroidobacteraceae bacterium]